MNRTLGWIAVIGLGVGVVSLALAWTLGGRDIRQRIAEVRSAHHRGGDDRADWSPWSTCDDSAATVSGSERRLPWPGGDSFEVVTPVPVRLIPADGGDVVIRGAPAVIAHLQLRGGRLAADCHGLGASSGAVEIEVPAHALRRVNISGAGKVTLEKIRQSDLALTISGSGQMRAQGTVEHVSATISGAGDVRLGDLATKRLTAKISGSGFVEAAPKDEADITLSGSGTVKLQTRPAALHSRVSGSGRILQPDSADKK